MRLYWEGTRHIVSESETWDFPYFSYIGLESTKTRLEYA